MAEGPGATSLGGTRMNRRPPAALVPVLAALATLLSVLLTAGPAAAVAAGDAGAAAEHRRVVGYWTPERMHAAADAAALLPAVPTAPPAAVPAAEAQPAAVTGRPWAGGGDVTRTTGKVFFTSAGRDFFCSGSSVAAANASLVLTAGHCVWIQGGWVSNFAFVPAYDDGDRPLGTWTARDLLTTPGWRGAQDFTYDVGFAVMRPQDGVRLADAVGAQAMSFNAPRGQQVHAFGYPHAAPYDGGALVFCAGQVVADTYYGSADSGLACTMTGGSSGGPWLADFDGSSGSVVSLTSFAYRGVPNVLWGPYLGPEALDLYRTAETR
jgi:hypothetical protein